MVLKLMSLKDLIPFDGNLILLEDYNVNMRDGYTLLH